jgi:Ni,Fe-hydrogenase I small subunit
MVKYCTRIKNMNILIFLRVFDCNRGNSMSMCAAMESGFWDWLTDLIHPNYKKDNMRAILSMEDPGFKNLSEKDQEILISKKIEYYKRFRFTS